MNNIERAVTETRARGQNTNLQQQGMVDAHVCNPGTWEAEKRQSA